MQQISIHAIAITYNPDVSVLSRQLASLKGQVDAVVIVDNASLNIKEIKTLIGELPSQYGFATELIENTSNLGLGKAQNIGVCYAKEAGGTHVLILDQDSILDKDFVKGLLFSEQQLKEKAIKVAAVGPTYYNESTGEVYPVTKYNGPFISRIQPVSEPVEATFIIASGSLIKISVLEEVGMMNEDLFIDYIDVEWSFRAKSFGYGVYASPNAKMKHSIGDNRVSIFGRTISVHSPLRRYYLYRNSIYMIRNKDIDLGYKIREVTFNAIRFTVFLLLSKERGKYFRYSIAGFRDGLKGVVGKCPHTFK